ncbi:MAG: YggT family protein [Candidatus Eremiobacteraeota bacterium]|nr:YggT family protein [Candidatus Eremiobacteraeota bacterium]
MTSLSCDAWRVVGWALQIFWLAMLLYAVVSWVPSLQGRWSYYVARIVEPVLLPVRRIIPPLGGFDLSFIVVILLVGYVMRSLPPAYCYYQ